MKIQRALSFVIFAFIAAVASAQPAANDYGWMQKIRTDHPRMFFTAEDIQQMREAAVTFESEAFSQLSKRADALLGKEVIFKNELAKTGESTRNHQYGHNAADAALMWHITQDRKYLDLSKYLLKRMIEYYELRTSNNLNIEWYVFTQISVLCAYDWIYNDLSTTERKELGTRLYNALHDAAVHEKRLRPRRHRENNGKQKSGLYGPRALPWYLGLTFYGEGINDERCREMLRSCYDLHQKTFAWRSKMLEGNGGAGCGTVGYAFGAYPYAEYDFIYSLRSATGIDITPQMEYMIGYLRYMDWIRLPGNREFGAGDANHSNCKLPGSIGLHINELTHLFGERHPEILPWASKLLARYKQPTVRYGSASINFLPMLHRFKVGKSNMKPVSQQKSMHFKPLGQIYMRSGVGDYDTYAMFTTERLSNQHQHFDQNNFVIYKRGFRALDSGTRPQPGLHLSHYYARTVAHNCITIRMPEEKMPNYWNSGPAKGENKDTPVPNDGGQRNSLAAKLLKHEEGEHYVYIASDATKCYHEDKAELVVREFVWLNPDVFVIFDRVVSDNAKYPKKWLYHTAAEPELWGKGEFSEMSQGGKSICRTLLPNKANIKKIGGEGRQFWSDGQNWPIPTNKRSWIPKNDHPLVGQWRVEVSPKKAAEKDYFLHIIQVGDNNLETLPKTKTIESDTEVSLSFNYNGKSYCLTFDKTKNHGCKIEVNRL